MVCRRGRVVSLAAIYDTEVRTDAGAVRVGGVCGVGTRPDRRGPGLSTATLRDAERTVVARTAHWSTLPPAPRRCGAQVAGAAARAAGRAATKASKVVPPLLTAVRPSRGATVPALNARAISRCRAAAWGE